MRVSEQVIEKRLDVPWIPLTTQSTYNSIRLDSIRTYVSVPTKLCQAGTLVILVARCAID